MIYTGLIVVNYTWQKIFNVNEYMGYFMTLHVTLHRAHAHFSMSFSF